MSPIKYNGMIENENNKLIFNDCLKLYINLDSRTDRKLHMEQSLKLAGFESERIRGIDWHECNLSNPQFAGMVKRGTLGAIGCHQSQVSCMRRALKENKSVLIMEDDLVFCEDFLDRIKIVEDFCNNNSWDVIFLGGTVHAPVPEWHTKGHTNTELTSKDCNCNLGVDIERVEGSKHIFKAYGVFSTYCYLVNLDSIPKILSLFDKHVHTSMGIDWLFIKLSPQMNNFVFLSGCTRQYNNQSNIGNGVTNFDAFKNLGQHWFTNKLEDFDPLTIKW
jgi:GR25 family glycosyltransferase involved in LPS biosynthesis